jgi:hypothetical protein
MVAIDRPLHVGEYAMTAVRPQQLTPAAILVADTDLMWRAVLETIEGLTEDEFFWEPAAGCWSIRPDPAGGYAQDWMPSPPVAPFTTIAWRLAHIGQSLASHARRLFHRGDFSYDTYRPAGTVEGERSFLEDSFRSWRDGIDGSGEALTPELVAEVLSFNHHHLSHASEVSAIRQLYQAQRPPDDDPLVAACLQGDAIGVASMVAQRSSREAATEHRDLVTLAAAMGHWQIVALLLDSGWPADSAVGPTALHHAAAMAPAEVVAMLIKNGADPSRRDPNWDATPKGWAEYFGNRDVAESLP